ncbi:DUF3383 family protein [Phocoenobacter skyensis]|uniref:Mu-like prophage tail sheath protein gpL n=1 Tax=Phocoenobacter skyensis TaxID=97481 RepID=A0A1H8A488_9PAST|nr:DUF3383 family protein [Pasteurella skyensis]QLB23321.1 hypothetical protein A6B44_08925 [Pasteurella skyensis]SEM65565.1 Protein of unknown function [Pasteurella skyensis]
MANLDRLVSVQISLNTTGISVPSFSDIIIVAPHSLSNTRMMAITGADQLLDLGLSSDTKLYKAAASTFSQIPHVDKVYIGRQAANETEIKVTRAVTGDYTVTVGDESVTQNATSSSTLNSISTGLATKLAALSNVTSATASDGVITVQCDSKIGVKGKLSIGESTSTENWAECLTAIKDEGGSWYGVAITSREKSDVIAVAEWVEANGKLFVTASSDKHIVDGGKTDDIGSILKDRQFFRTAVHYDPQADSEFTDIAAMAKLFTYYPGSATWANKRLAGVTADYLKEGEAIVAHGKNVNTFEMFNGQFALTQLGKVAAGEWIDIIRFRDWLEATMQSDVAFTIINADGKVPYTDAGIEMIAASMQQSLDLGIRRGGIAPDELDEEGKVIPSYIINKPLASSISSNRKASRFLQNMTWIARLAGAIHLTEIKGSLAYEL